MINENEEEIIDAEEIIQAAYDELEEEVIKSETYRMVSISMIDMIVQKEINEFLQKRHEKRMAEKTYTMKGSNTIN